MLSTVLLIASNAASAAPPCLILARRASSKIGALRERSYERRIHLQVLKTSKKKMMEVREFLRAKEWRATLFSCGICEIYHILISPISIIT